MAAAEKIRSGQDLTLELSPTPKLIDEVRAAHPDLPIVGFKVETGGDDEATVSAARSTLERADLSFVVANDAGVMGEATTRVLVVRADDVLEFEGSKADAGGVVAEELLAELRS